MYIAIDLKSFYASVECVERQLDPLDACLVVADVERTEKTICLAVSPALKAYGIPGRARLFEVVQRVREINRERLARIPDHRFTGKSSSAAELAVHPDWELDYIAARPRMAFYMRYSTRIYQIYLQHVSAADVHVYSIDEVFIDAEPYRLTYGLSAHELAMTMIRAVLAETGITATAGIGTNLYLCKIAMDIVAKHMPADRDGVRIAELDERSYREQLWRHRPLTDFWRIGRGITRKLEENGLFTMGDVARCSLGAEGEHYNEDLLYRLFGINAELLIDHAWGVEPCGIADIKAYRPESHSLSSGQVLKCPYPHERARLVVREMTDQLVLSMVEKGFATDQLALFVNYDSENLEKTPAGAVYTGPVESDYYGRPAPKPAHGSTSLPTYTASSRELTEAMMTLFDRITDPVLSVRRLNVAVNRLKPLEEACEPDEAPEQLDLFTDYEARDRKRAEDRRRREKELRLQQAVVGLRQRYGKNAVIKGMNLEEGATALERNGQIGGHRA